MDALSQASIIEDDEVSNDLNSDLNSIRMVLSKDFHYNPNYNYENYDGKIKLYLHFKFDNNYIKK